MLKSHQIYKSDFCLTSSLFSHSFGICFVIINYCISSPFLQVVKVYVSVFGDERGKEVAISGLKAKAKYVRGQLGKRMKLRLTPEVRFIEDESLERGSRVRTNNILKNLPIYC